MLIARPLLMPGKFTSRMGQYDLYQPILEEVAPEYKLYPVVSDVAYRTDLQRNRMQTAIGLGFRHPSLRPLTEFAVA